MRTCHWPGDPSLDLTERTAFTIGATQTLMGKGGVLLGPTTALTIDGLLSPGNGPGLLTYDGAGTVDLGPDRVSRRSPVS